MLAQLRAESAKAKKPPPRQQQQLNVPAAASVQPGAQADDEEERPKGNWMQLMKQKKQAKEDSIAHMVRVRHAVLVIQVCSRHRGVGQAVAADLWPCMNNGLQDANLPVQLVQAAL